jgi:opacity protein-like surface antigen
MRWAMVICAAACVLALAGTATGQEQRFTIVARGSLNTAGELFPNPNATDPVARAQSYSYTNFYGVGVELQYHFPASALSLGFSGEYVRNSGGRNIAATAQRSVPVDDYYMVIPVELTAYFRIPVTTGSFMIVMGGGLGMYMGARYYATAGIQAPTVATRLGYGIHVLVGVGYRITEWFTVSADIKFRDAQYQTTNAFRISSVRYGDIVVNLPQGPFESSIHTDGMVIQIGLGVSF